VPTTDTLEKALTALDKALGANPGNGYGNYSIYIIVSASTPVPSMKLTKTSVSADYDLDDVDHNNNGLTFPNLGNLKHPLSITITSTETSPPTLYLAELGSMFALEELNVAVTMSIENVTLHGLSQSWTKTWNDHNSNPVSIVYEYTTNIYNTVPSDNTAVLVSVGKNNSFEM
jgi:hypothetical protein